VKRPTAIRPRCPVARFNRRPTPGLVGAVALFLGLFVAGAALATSVNLRVDRQKVSESDTVTVQVVARGSYDEIVPPTSEGFDFESSGRSSQVSIIGTRMERSDTYTYVGRPRRVGKHGVSAVVLRLRGKDVARSNTLEIEVVGERASLGTAVPPEQAVDMRRYLGEKFFVRPQIAATRPYAGQPFVLSYELFWSRRTHVSGIRELSAPKYTGFEVEDLLGGKPQEQEPARFGGAPYFRQMTRKVLLTAATPGSYEVLGPRYRVDAGDIFSTRAYKVGPPPMKIDVRAVPEDGKPAAYQDGSVGRLEVDGWLLERNKPVRERKVKVGERVLLHLEVRGMGNLYGLSKLGPGAMAGMDVEPLQGRPDEHVKVTANGTEGKRVWQYVLTFSSGGRFEIPAVSFHSFDPYDEKYKTSAAGPFVIHVAGPQTAPAKAPVNPKAPGTTAKPRGVMSAKVGEAPVPTLDPWVRLRPIAAEAKLAKTQVVQWTDASWFWPAASLPWLFALLLGVGRVGASIRARGSDDRDVALALKTARKAIDTARGQADGGYAALRAAAAVYLATRADLNLAGATWAAVRTRLRDRGVSEPDVETLIEQLEHCDYARFAPTGDPGKDLERTAVTLARVLESIDATLPRGTLPKGSSSVSVGSIALLVGGAAVLGAMTLPTVAVAASVDQEFAAANQAFIAHDYKDAQARYERLLKHNLPAAAIHYNLANTLVRLDRLGEAVGHFKHALRLEPDARLRGDITANLELCRDQLAERARRRHRILHIFDESTEVEVALGRAAPRTLLGGLILGLGLAIVALLLVGWGPWRSGPAPVRVKFAVGLACVLQLAAGAWLAHAQGIDTTARFGVVVEEDAPMSPCTGVGETVDLPEGLEVRTLRTRPDGRVEVRLPNGRIGCMKPTALYRTS